MAFLSIIRRWQKGRAQDRRNTNLIYRTRVGKGFITGDYSVFNPFGRACSNRHAAAVFMYAHLGSFTRASRRS
jgi:hypothetical protein